MRWPALLLLLCAPAAHCYLASRFRYYTDESCTVLDANELADNNLNQATAYLAGGLGSLEYGFRPTVPHDQCWTIEYGEVRLLEGPT